MVEALAFGQGFNRRYDAMNWGLSQEAFGVELFSGGALIIGATEDIDTIGPSNFFFQSSIILTKIDDFGAVLTQYKMRRPWHNLVPGWSNCCDVLPDGGLLVGGSMEDTLGVDRVHLSRFDQDLDTIWTRNYGDPAGTHFWLGQQVCSMFNGDAIVVGYTDQNDDWNGFAIRININGDEMWTKIYETPFSDGLSSVMSIGNGDIVMSGSRFVSSDNGEHWVQRSDPQGNILWTSVWGGNFSEGTTNVLNLFDGNIGVFSGRGYASNYSSMRPYISKLNSSNGAIIWEREYGEPSYGTILYSGKQCPNSDLIAAGVTFNGPGPQVQRGLLIRTESNGDSIWYNKYFYFDSLISEGQGRFYDILPTLDGGFIATGAARAPVDAPYPVGYGPDIWVVKVDADGCIVPGCNTVGITEQATNLLDALRIWPNPAQGQCTVHLELPASVGTGALLLTVVAADGRVALQHSITGNGTYPLDLHGLSAGLYHVHVSQGGRWLTGGRVVVE